MNLSLVLFLVINTVFIRKNLAQAQFNFKEYCNKSFSNVTALLISVNNDDALSETLCNFSLEKPAASDTQFYLIKFELNDASKDTLKILLSKRNESGAFSDIASEKQVVSLSKSDISTGVFYLTSEAPSSLRLRLTDTDKFSNLKSITITSYTHTDSDTNNCKPNFYRCKAPGDVCIDKKLKCDDIGSCLDNSDEAECVPLIPNVPADNSSFTNSSSNASLVIEIPDTTKSQTTYVSRNNVLISILVFLICSAIVLTVVYVYGRRRQKWREFIAQLDNNTDWEYEQLDETPSLSISRTSMTPVFNVNVANSSLTQRPPSTSSFGNSKI